MTPLFSCWRLCGEQLPERLLEPEQHQPAFSLPGANALAEFASLLGEDETPKPAEDTPLSPPQAPFPLPALLPEDVNGEVLLRREIDFGAIHADQAYLCFDLLCGQGEIELESCPPRAGALKSEPFSLRQTFGHGPLTLDVTGALAQARRCRLTLRFTEARPAGVLGAVMLRTVACARLDRVIVAPCTGGQVSFTANVHCLHGGDYLLRAQLCLPQAQPAILREMTIRGAAGEHRPISMSFHAEVPAFTAGTPYEAPALKISLFKRKGDGQPGRLCDSLVLQCGCPGPVPRFYLPLAAEDLTLPPDALCARLTGLHVHAVSLPGDAPDLLLRSMTAAGIAALPRQYDADARERLGRHACVAFDAAMPPRQEAVSPALSAWRLCGLVTYPRPLPVEMSDNELLLDAAGRSVLPEEHADTLAWLRAVSIRLQAEAMRQGRLSGPLCSPGEPLEGDVAQALQTALAPTHLSALPLSGAWWVGSRFSASLHAFLHNVPSGQPLRAQAVLEDADGNELAQVSLPCPPEGGNLGLIEAQLPQTSCVLELTTRLFAGEQVLEESTIPVYVGERGPLQAAF